MNGHDQSPGDTISSGRVTRLLRAWGDGDENALQELMPLVFQELRRLARGHLRRSPQCRTLQPTALVNEAYLRLVGSPIHGFDSRRQFFAFASKVLREVLVDYARARGAAKRGGDAELANLDDAGEVAARISVDPDTILALNAALTKLETLSRRQARVVELRYFAGLTLDEIALALDCSEVTARRDWSVARRWLLLEMSSPGP